VALQILGHVHPMRDALVLLMSPFAQMGDTLKIGVSLISLKRETDT
jgi:hypothetical protein